MEITLKDETFETEVLKSNLPVLVDFWAEWCAPCRMVGPIVDELAKDYEGKMKVGKLNVDENSKTASQYNIMSIPTLLIFKNGKIAKSIIGAQSKERFKQQIDEVLSSDSEE
ncbi:thioredoxin [Candidatus Microgenomates bacterium]|nr:thioredoxin [Candidatus Microgenomates bacterium]